MKKLFSLALVIMSLMISTNHLDAQNKIEINREAAELTEVLRKQIKFTPDQGERIYNVLKDYRTKKARLNESTLSNNPEAVEKLENYLSTEIKAILSEEQFLKYQDIVRNQS